MRSVKILLITLVTLLLPNLSSAQTHLTNEAKGHTPIRLSTQVKECVAIMELVNQFALTPTDHFEKYRIFDVFSTLDSLAKDQELIALTHHYNAVVRSYAFWSLRKRNHSQWFPILIDHLTDPDEILVKGVRGYPYRLVGDLLLTIVEIELDSDARTLSSQQQQSLDSNLIFRAPALLSRTKLLLKLEPRPFYYERIKQLASEKEYAAVIALARFRRPEDRIYISTLLNAVDLEIQSYGLGAVIEYPDSCFFEDLLRIHQDGLVNRYPKRSKMIYEALVLYETPQTRSLLLQTLQDTTNQISSYQTPLIFMALEKYPSQYWDDVRMKIRLSEAEKNAYRSNF